MIHDLGVVYFIEAHAVTLAHSIFAYIVFRNRFLYGFMFVCIYIYVYTYVCML